MGLAYLYERKMSAQIFREKNSPEKKKTCQFKTIKKQNISDDFTFKISKIYLQKKPAFAYLIIISRK